MNLNNIKKVIGYTLELVGLMATVILLAVHLNGHSVRLSTDFYGLLDDPIIFSWIYLYIVAGIIAVWSLFIDENGDENE